MCRPITVVLASLLVTAITSSVLHKRIINGEEAEPASHPYIVSLQMYNASLPTTSIVWKSMCGGALIDTDWVLTAAHCVDTIPEDTDLRGANFQVKLGEHHLNQDTEFEYGRQVYRIIKHPQYYTLEVNGDLKKMINDIALIQLATPATLGPNVQIATRSSDEYSYLNTECVLAGWGRINAGHPAVVLQEVNMTHISNYRCDRMYGSQGDIIDTNICAYDTSPDPVEGHGNSCKGDSGGPMMCGEDHSVLVGMDSWGMKDCGLPYPSVYTRVSKYTQWIDTTMENYAMDW